MIRFTIPSNHLDRLARLHLAVNAGQPIDAISHVHLQVTPNRVRFTATNGRLFAALIIDTDDKANAATDATLDCVQFTAAIKAITKDLSSPSASRNVQVDLGPGEVRFSRGHTSAIVRRVQRTYPAVDHIFSKPAGMQWVPCTASLDQDLASVAKKIAGKIALMFVTPVPMTSPAPQLWQKSTGEQQVTIRIMDLQPLMSGPAYWSDGSLMLLVMPVSRPPQETQIDQNE